MKFIKFRKLKACQKSKEEKMDDKILYRGKRVASWVIFSFCFVFSFIFSPLMGHISWQSLSLITWGHKFHERNVYTFSVFELLFLIILFGVFVFVCLTFCTYSLNCNAVYRLYSSVLTHYKIGYVGQFHPQGFISFFYKST